MDTTETAVEYIRFNKTPYWWVKQGQAKVGTYTDSDNVEESVNQFRELLRFLPPGSYRLECSDKETNRSGSLSLPFTKSQTTLQPVMQPVQSTNAYGISDQVFKQIQEETRQRFMFEQMYVEFQGFIKDWPEYKKKIDKMEEYLKDDDSDGTPNFMETAKKGSEIVKNVAEVKKVFEGGSLFR